MIKFMYPLVQDLPPEVKEAQEKKLDGLKKQQENLNRLAVERKIFLRNRKIKFFGINWLPLPYSASYFLQVLLKLFKCGDWLLKTSNFLYVERRKIERRIRRLEKQQRSLSGQAQEAEVAEQLSRLKEDLEYVRVSIGIACNSIESKNNLAMWPLWLRLLRIILC